MILEPKLIEGGTYQDHRGTLQFVNPFDMKDVCILQRIQTHQQLGLGKDIK